MFDDKFILSEFTLLKWCQWYVKKVWYSILFDAEKTDIHLSYKMLEEKVRLCIICWMIMRYRYHLETGKIYKVYNSSTTFANNFERSCVVVSFIGLCFTTKCYQLKHGTACSTIIVFNVNIWRDILRCFVFQWPICMYMFSRLMWNVKNIFIIKIKCVPLIVFDSSRLCTNVYNEPV